MNNPGKILILTYYFPPSGGSGVQRWMYFSRYLPEFGISPFVITVDPERASYKFTDEAFLEKVKTVPVFRTASREPLRVYTRLMGGDSKQHIPQGFAGESQPGFFQKLSRFIRGNFFLPDARIGWNAFAVREAKRLIAKENIKLVVTTGPPHSTHLSGLQLKRETGVLWIADFRDPWTEVYYNRMLYRTRWAEQRDKKLESKVLLAADRVLTIGPGMSRLLQSKLPELHKRKVHYIYNGYDADLFKGLKRQPEENFFTICHTGILSENQPITAFLLGLKEFFRIRPEAKPVVRIRFVGKVSPALLDETRTVINEEQLILTGYVPHSAAIQHMLNADLLLNSFALSSDSAILVSGKLMEYLATGNPVLALGSTAGDAADLMKDMPHAHIFDRGDIRGISSFIENIYFHWKNKDRFPPVDLQRFSRYETTRQLADWIRPLV